MSGLLEVSGMKKFVISALSFLILISSYCYDDTQNATVRINLGNIPVKVSAERSLIDMVSGVLTKNAYAASQQPVLVKLHIAAYSGEGVAAAESISITGGVPPSSVEISVPAGNGIKFLVVAENDLGAAQYYGFASADLRPGSNNDITVSVYDNFSSHGAGPSWTSLLNFTYSSNSSLLKWNSIGIKVKFVVNRVPLTGGGETLYYQGYNTQLVNTPSGYSYYIYLEFEPFPVRSSPFQQTNI